MNNTVKNPINEVFSIWEQEMSQYIGENNVSIGSSGSIASAPFAKMMLLPGTGARYDLAGDETAINVPLQIESYADGKYAINDAYEIDDVSHQILVNLGFRRTYGPELIDNIEVKIKRVVSRYTRMYTGIPFVE